MYNSYRVSRTGRTIQRRKVDTGTVIDPSKVQAYMEYLLNNGYVQLPRPLPAPDGTYLLVPDADIDVSHLLSKKVYADEFIASVLSTQNIFLTGTETVYIKLETKIDIDPNTNWDIFIGNAYNDSSQFIQYNIWDSQGILGPFVFLFVFCNGQYSITLLNAVVSQPDLQFAASYDTRTFLEITDTNGKVFVNPKVTLVSVGSE